MIERVKRFVRELDDDTAGAMSVEKILILALIAVPLLVILLIFRGKITEWFNTESDKLKP